MGRLDNVSSIGNKNTGRRRMLSLISGAAAVGLTGCVDIDEEGDPAGDEDEEPEPSDDNEEDEPADNDETTEEEGDDADDTDEPDDISATIGELVEGEQMHLVVEDFERDVDFGEFTEPDSDNEFVLAEIALQNVSDQFLTVSNLLQTRLRDDEDFQYDQTFVGDMDATFNDGQFAPGEVERGGIPFEIPTDATGLELVFDLDVSIFGGVERARIDLTTEASTVARLEQDLNVEINDVGDAVTSGDVTVNVNDVRTETELGSFTTPDEGNEYTIVDLSVTNDTGEERTFSTILQMLLKDGDGRTYQEDLSATASLDRAFDEGTPLSDGETRRGELVYEVTEGVSPLYWVFEFALFEAGDKTFWQVR